MDNVRLKCSSSSCTVSSAVGTCSHWLPVFQIEDVFGETDTCPLSENQWTVSFLKFSFKILINVYSVCRRLSAKNSLVPRACPPERRFERKSLVTRLSKVLLGSLSNHDDDGNKDPTNLHIWQWKTLFLHALHVHFSSYDILKMFSFFLRPLRWPVLQLCGRREHMMTNVQFCLLMSQALVPI